MQSGCSYVFAEQVICRMNRALYSKPLIATSLRWHFREGQTAKSGEIVGANLPVAHPQPCAHIRSVRRFGNDGVRIEDQHATRIWTLSARACDVMEVASTQPEIINAH